MVNLVYFQAYQRFLVVSQRQLSANQNVVFWGLMHLINILLMDLYLQNLANPIW